MKQKPIRSTDGRKRRAAAGAGRLYKRGAGGHEYPPESPANLPFWLAYSIPNPKGGRGQRVRLPLRDGEGHAITDRKQAEAERRRILAPYQTGHKVDTLKAVVAHLADTEADHVKAVDEATPPLRIADAWKAYLVAPDKPRSGKATEANYERHWNRFATWIGQAQPDVEFLRDITPKTAALYAADMNAAGYGPNTFNKHSGFLRLLFRVLADEARVTVNPFAKVRPRELNAHSRRELTIEELTAILTKAEGDLALLLYLGACTGLRLGDCATLAWGEVDLARGIIRRVPNKTSRKGKPVLVGIPPALHDRLSQIPKRTRTGYVLPSMAEEYRRNSSGITNAVKAHVLDCGIDVHAHGTGERIKRDADGIPERDKETGKVIVEDTRKPAVVDVGFHSLRHTWVSMHAARGTPQAVIQASVGHANPAMTAHYTHVSEATARDVALALPAFSGETTEPKREPLPQWAREIIEGMTAKTWKTAKAALLAPLAAKV